MNISIRLTVPSEAEELSAIQKAAFKPLYDRYHDSANPYLRGAGDILWRLNRDNRYYTILADGEIVGGIYYRLSGKRSPVHDIAQGEYYLARIYVHPDRQREGIAREALRLSEKEFPDARTFYVDFPADLDKNRRFYSSAGYGDTGETECWGGDAPTLAMFKKEAREVAPAEVKLPVIYEAERTELPECVNVIHQSFATVAEEFGLTPENCPRHTSFIPLPFLEAQMDWGWHMYALLAGRRVIGYMSLSREGDGVFKLHNLAVLPEYRHSGFGGRLLNHAKEAVKSTGGEVLKIGIIEESTVLKNWYMANGFVPTDTETVEHLPFTVGHLEWRA